MSDASEPSRRPRRPLRIEDWIEQDLSAAAEEGRLSPAFDRDDVVDQVADLLGTTPPRSPVLTGGAGVGKTAVIHELVRRARAPTGVSAAERARAPALLREHRLVQLSLRSIAAAFPKPGQATEFAQKLFGLLARTDLVLYLRDIHLGWTLDLEPVFYRYLCQSGLPLLAEGLPTPVESMIDHSSELAEHLVLVPVSEPPLARVRGMVERWSEWQRARGAPGVRPEAQRIAVELTGRFLGDRPFPRKVLDLLAQTRDTTRAPDGSLRLVEQRDVVARFSATSRVPVSLVDPEVPLDLGALRVFLEQRLLGQEEAIEAVVKMVGLIKSGLSDLARPFGVFLFVGPTGVGKTHTAQLLAEYLFGDRQRMIRLNMADFAGEGGALSLFGNPSGFRPEERAGVLTSRLRGHPFGVLLLDEFEKANPKVYDAFLQLFDEGRFINGAGDAVSVTSLIVIATSNAGAEVFREAGLGFRPALELDALDAELDRRLNRIFRFELLNRFDRIVHFHPLDRANIRAIATRDLARLMERDGLANRGLHLEIDPELVEWLASHGYHPHYGARFLRREIERHVTAVLADLIVREHPPRGSRIQLGVRSDRVVARLLPAAEPRATVLVPARESPKEVQLDREGLLAEARAWVDRWAPLRLEAAARRDAASLLIDESNAPGFWDDAERARGVLRRYASLDARAQADERLLAPLGALDAALAGGRQPSLDELAGLVNAVALHYRRWLDLGAAEGPAAAWLVVGPGDPLSPAPAFVAELVEMYRAWFARRGFAVDVVAEEEHQGQLLRAVLEVEGPGAWAVAQMEHGRHRRRRDGDIERAQVDVLARHGHARSDVNVHLEAARQTRGRLLPRRSVRLRVEIPARAVQLSFLGAEREVLAHFGGDLAAALAAPSTEAELARTYAITGGTARDPRTDAAHASVKEVLRGDLEVFLRAWEAR